MKPDCKNNKNTQLVQLFKQKTIIHLFGVTIEINEPLFLVMHPFNQLLNGEVLAGTTSSFIKVVMSTNVDISIPQTEDAEEHDGGFQLLLPHHLGTKITFKTDTDGDRIVVMDFIVNMCALFVPRATLIYLTVFSDIIMVADSSPELTVFCPPVPMPLVNLINVVFAHLLRVVNHDIIGFFSAPKVFSEFELGVMNHDGVYSIQSL